MKRLISVGILVLLAVGGGVGGWFPAQAENLEDKELRNIALLRMDIPRGFQADERSALASDFLQALFGTGEFAIVSRDDMDDIIQELKFQTSDLVDQEEVVELGGMLGVDHFVTCSIRPIKGIFQVTANLISVEKARVERIVVKRCENKYEYLTALFNEIAYDLAGIEDQKGLLMIESDPSEGEVFLFGISQGYTPLTISLAPGTYVVELKKSGFWDLEKDLEVSAKGQNACKVNFRKKKRFKLGDYIGGKGFWNKD